MGLYILSTVSNSLSDENSSECFAIVGRDYHVFEHHDNVLVITSRIYLAK